jgi:NADH dehydrogenase
MKNIVIVGAGYAGVLTAKKLAKKFKKNEDVNITIIDKNPFHTMLTELHEVAANRVDEDSIKMSLNKIFAGRRVNIKLDTVQSIDFEGKKVLGKAESYDYDYLVLAAGSKPTYFGVPGAEEFAFKLWSYDDAVKLKDHIHNCFREAARETDIEEKRRLLNFYVVGAGFTGVEMVGELAEYVPILCEKFEIDREDVTITNVDVLERTVPILPEKLSAKVEKRLAKMGVDVILKTGVCGMGKDYIELRQNDACVRKPTNTVIWTAGIESADITSEAAKTLSSANRGRIKLDKYLRSVDDENVYVVGDNMLYTPEGSDTPVPQMVENCEQSAKTAARNIAVAITGEGEMEEYKPKFHGVMVCVGGRYGVARVGLPNLMFNLPSFLAMFAKHFINIIYFVQVLGWNKIFSYLKHEFFTIRNNRSFVGGHFSNKTPSFMLVALRIWLGAVWLFEGIMKIVEGWFKKPKLEGFFGGANAWYDSILNGKVTSGGGDGGDAVTGATSAAVKFIDTLSAKAGAVIDTVSSATGEAAEKVVEKVGKVLINWDIFGWFQIYFVSGKELSHSTLNDYAFKINVPLMNWFTDKVILANDGVTMFFQIFIVVAEILIGLALIGGLFTTPASAFSLVLQVMFVMTTGLYLGTFWMIFAAIALLFGSGRTLGLDYYAMPYLKKRWKKVRWVRKSYLYND